MKGKLTEMKNLASVFSPVPFSTLPPKQALERPTKMCPNSQDKTFKIMLHYDCFV